MELVIGFVIIVALLILFDLAALRWGVNSRHSTSDWKSHTDSDYYQSSGPGLS